MRGGGGVQKFGFPYFVAVWTLEGSESNEYLYFLIIFVCVCVW